MRTMDLSPLYRASVGFDRLLKSLDTAGRLEESAYSYPPYNIEKVSEDAYRIVMAVAGFGEDELDITAKENSLVISGRKEKAEGEDEVTFLHRGIANRAFERRFDLADHIKVTGAKLENGLLAVELVREIPEAMKPRSISITSGEKSSKVIENEAA
ncbi:Hsp20 family protein [Pelagibius marinus]|uniref:Hsp20 family protein n=1 Tax=Pelagibius marinus TaxID=2762760 RepID=UPI001872EA04|nr:Hsp20 family protein [Pelagibius marinus]